MNPLGTHERRSFQRYDASGLSISLRVKGRLSRLQGAIVDFNRHGVAVCLDQPLKKDCQCYVTLNLAGEVLHDIVGVVHNCTALDYGYRCGIRFRPDSALQFDAEAVQNQLRVLEDYFAGALAETG